MNLSAILLAAGHGTRMRSETPKVLHKIAGFSMLEHVISIVSSIPENIEKVKLNEIVVVTSEQLESHNDFKKIVSSYSGVKTIEQRYKFGTGHAVYTGLNAIKKSKSDIVLVMYCDVPLITIDSVMKLIKEMDNEYDVVGTAFEHNGSKPYGRFEMDDRGDVKRVVEASDVDELNPMMTNLCNAGMLLANRKFLTNYLNDKCKGLTCKSFSKEVYLTDIFERGRSGYIKIDEEEAVGVNNRTELATAEGIFQRRLRDKMMKKGVTLIAPETVFFAADTVINHDTVIEPYVQFGLGVEIDSACQVKSFCYIEGAKIGRETVIGPFARIRPNSQIENNCKIGNFVEVKNAYIGSGVKSCHLSYLGDVHIGSNSNIGAGVVVCNYDGVNKHHTTVGSNVQVGANSSIISPRYIGDSSKIGAGSVITEDVMENHTAIARAPQISKKRKSSIPSN
jgi:bifunctional UDP-N-acetylglucosamine pyrophosphorylase/glucosamine-1-phosphate N-acetyltransferase